jgi:tetratricopeptide (TPR) repeat protein
MRRSAMQVRTRSRACALFVRLGLPVAAMLLLLVPGSHPQESTGYRETLLSIQQQIEGGNLEAARTLIAAAGKQHPHDGGLENLLGVVEIQEGHINEASRAFSAAIVHDPRLTSAYLNLSRIRMQTAVTDQTARAEALRLSLKALRLEPANDEANYQAATILFWDKHYQTSLGHLNHLSKEASTKVGAEALNCADHASMSESDATSDAEKALAANLDLTEQYADTCLGPLREAHRADLIEPLFLAVAQHQALSPPGQRILGLAQEAEGKLPDARASLEKAYTEDPNSVTILEDLTRVAKAAHDYEGALGYLGHARALAPNNSALAFEFGTICVRMGLFAEARKAIGEALQLAPDNPGYNLEMGLVISFSEDPSQALPYLKRFHELRPQDPEGILALGTANFRAKDYDESRRWLKQAVESGETAADAHFYLGRIARQEGQMDAATAELKQSLTLNADQPDALAELGQISLQARDFPNAEKYFDQALHGEPDSYAANFGLLQLYARTGDARRDQQSKRFDQIKNEKEERDKQMMRVIEIRPDVDPSSHNPQPHGSEAPTQ